MSNARQQARTKDTMAAIRHAYEQLEPSSDNTGVGRGRSLRDKAFENFARAGFPTTRDEDWKYTDLTNFAARSAELLNAESTPDTDTFFKNTLAEIPVSEHDTIIVFTNGHYRRDLSTALDAAVEIRMLDADDAAFARHLESASTAGPLVALNTAFMSAAVLIRLGQNQKADHPIHVVFLADDQSGPVLPKIVLQLEQHSRATIVQHHIGGGANLTNAVTTIDCAAHAELSFIRLQNDDSAAQHISRQDARLEEHAHINAISVDLGGQMARNDLNIDLAGENATAAAHGLLVIDGNRHIDNHLRVDHRGRGTTSVENFRGIANDAGSGVFNGKIIVHEGADGTDAQMNNRNLLLSDGCEINTKPELEIYTDDVKCAHGSTTGQLDDNALYYLRARGIAEQEARNLLIAAFAEEVIDQVTACYPAATDYLHALINERLPI